MDCVIKSRNSSILLECFFICLKMFIMETEKVSEMRVKTGSTSATP